MASLSASLAVRIWAVLVEDAGADPADRDSFVSYVTAPVRSGHEYRFMGRLGSGGKLHYSAARGAWVSCYGEHETDERRVIVARVNQKLADL